MECELDVSALWELLVFLILKAECCWNEFGTYCSLLLYIPSFLEILTELCRVAILHSTKHLKCVEATAKFAFKNVFNIPPSP